MQRYILPSWFSSREWGPLMRVLFVTRPGDGHLNPLVPVARALVGAGHKVRFATSGPFVNEVQRRGFDAVGVGPNFRWDAALDTWPEGANNVGAASMAFWAAWWGGT